MAAPIIGGPAGWASMVIRTRLLLTPEPARAICLELARLGAVAWVVPGETLIWVVAPPATLAEIADRYGGPAPMGAEVADA